MVKTKLKLDLKTSMDFATVICNLHLIENDNNLTETQKHFIKSAGETVTKLYDKIY